MYAQQVNIQVISNNIANINTTGFKKSKAEFEDMMYQEVEANPLNSYLPGVNERVNQTIQVGTGVKLSSTDKLHSQGDIQPTTNQLDVAIHGEGFFQLRKPDGSVVYTRDGSFRVSADGSLVNSSGYVVDPGFAIGSDAAGISISKDGVISVRESDGTTVELGNLELARFINPAGLKALGGNQFQETEASGVPILGTPASTGFGELHQGYLEASNVDIVEEMVAMITAQRSYEINSKSIKTVEEMMSLANNLKRG